MAITSKCADHHVVTLDCHKCVRYCGAVLCTREENYHDDSDFYVIVWDHAESKLRQVYYDSTRYGGGGGAAVDATDDVKAMANGWLVEWAVQQYTAADERQSSVVQNGRRVRVFKGRKVPIGTVGTIFYWDEQTFSPRYRGGYKTGPDTVKVGIATSDRKDARGRFVDVAWTYAANCEVVDPTEYRTAAETIRAKAERVRDYWHAPFAKLQVA